MFQSQKIELIKFDWQNHAEFQRTFTVLAEVEQQCPVDCKSATFLGHTGWISGLHIAPMGHGLSAAAPIEPFVYGMHIATWKSLIINGHSDWVRCASYSPDGLLIISGGDDGTVRLWDAHNANALRIFRGHRGHVFSASFNPDGSRVVSSGDAGDQTVRVWAVDNGTILLIIQGHLGYIKKASYSCDGSELISTGDDGTVRRWNANNGDQLLVIESHARWANWVAGASPNPDGRHTLSVVMGMATYACGMLTMASNCRVSSLILTA